MDSDSLIQVVKRCECVTKVTISSSESRVQTAPPCLFCQTNKPELSFKAGPEETSDAVLMISDLDNPGKDLGKSVDAFDEVSLEEVPPLNEDSIVEVMRRVAKRSGRDACILGAVSKLYNGALKEKSVLRLFDLSEFVAKPEMISDYSAFFKLALQAQNPVASYLQDLSKIMVESDVEGCLLPLSDASKAGYDHATWMLSMTMIGAGYNDLGIHILNRIEGWKSRQSYVHGLGLEVTETLLKLGLASRKVLPMNLPFWPKCNFNHDTKYCDVCFLCIQYFNLRITVNTPPTMADP